ncbi:FitA-like ribbon-helix-helix domain-containing protein [Glycocaulis sp.]
MPNNLHLRNVPEATYQALKARAAAEGMSMSDYLKRLIEQDLKWPDWASVRARRARTGLIDLGDDAVRMVREERGENRIV